MNYGMNSRRNSARQVRQQQRLDAGFLSEHFPEVVGIVVSMMYSQKGMLNSLPRTVNFYPGSCALFKIDCLTWGCVDGGFDLTYVITSMIKSRRETSKGEISCEGSPSPDHSTITYEITVKYA